MASPGIFKRKYIFTLILFTFLFSGRNVFAWDVQLGIHHLIPKLWTGEQSYEGDSGETLKFKPDIDKTISGQTASFGIFFENILIAYEQGWYRYETVIPASNDSVTEDTDADIEIMEQRLGISYHLERELAGVFVGAGVTREKEQVESSIGDYTFEADVPFVKIGIDLIFNGLRIRVEQIHYSFGEHSAKVSSAGLLLYL